MVNKKASNETQQQAMAIAKGRQKQGQSKEQTKLIAQGIEKGISDYKKQQKLKARERDKARKKQAKQQTFDDKVQLQPDTEATVSVFDHTLFKLLPWLLLLLSWLYFLSR